MLKKDCSLLPHIKENIFGFNRHAGQIYGWEIQKFHIPQEWKYSQGESIKIAVIDTGCDLDHDDLKINILQGKNFVDPNKDPYDDNGHGTHVCGTISAANNLLGIVGVAPKSKIVPIKALNGDGNGSNETIADALIWAVNQKCDFITMSLGSPYDASSVRYAVEYATKNNVVIFCAAGNSGSDHDVMYPAKYKETIAIGSVDTKLNRSNFSCAGESLDFLSPGENIIGCFPDNNYAIMSGTSMANPFAVGCAAIAKAYAKKTGKILSNRDNYINLFKQNALQLSQKNMQNKKHQGYGIIQPSCENL